MQDVYCKKKFSINIGFEKMRTTLQAITASMNLYFNGESLRHVTDSMKLFGVNVTHQTIHNWIKKYIGLLIIILNQSLPKFQTRGIVIKYVSKSKGIENTSMQYLMIPQDFGLLHKYSEETKFVN